MDKRNRLTEVIKENNLQCLKSNRDGACNTDLFHTCAAADVSLDTKMYQFFCIYIIVLLKKSDSYLKTWMSSPFSTGT